MFDSLKINSLFVFKGHKPTGNEAINQSESDSYEPMAL